MNKRNSNLIKQYCEKITKREGTFARVKNSFKKYGKLGLVVYISAYILGIGVFYELLDRKVIKSDNVVEKFEHYKLDKYIDIRKKINDNPKTANLAIAYVLNYAFDLVRIPTVLLFLKYYFKRFK
jgi:hypothetical protein